MLGDRETERYVQLLAEHQLRLSGFIRTMVPDPDSAADVLQETNLVLWRKVGEFREDANFWAWASQIAFIQAKAFWRNQGRDRHAFGEELLAQLAELTQERSAETEERLALLRKCLKKLPADQRQLIRRRYASSDSLASLAAKVDKTPNAVGKSLHRARATLLECIERLLARGRSS